MSFFDMSFQSVFPIVGSSTNFAYKPTIAMFSVNMLFQFVFEVKFGVTQITDVIFDFVMHMNYVLFQISWIKCDIFTLFTFQFIWFQMCSIQMQIQGIIVMKGRSTEMAWKAFLSLRFPSKQKESNSMGDLFIMLTQKYKW